MSRPVTVTPDSDKRTPKLRARRITVDREKLGPVHAAMKHADLGLITGEVHDLSMHGVGVVLPARNGLGGLLLTGDRVESLEITAGTTVLYRGGATVRRISDEAERQVLGLEVDGNGLDLAALHRSGARQSFAQRWSQLQAGVRYDRVSPAFKAWVADLRSQLEATKEFLGQEEKALAAEDRLTRDEALAEYIEALRPQIIGTMDEVRAALHELVGHLSEEEHSLYRAFTRRQLVPLFAESPFIRRSFEKPLGYAGDYEMMNMLYRDHAEGDSLFGKALNIYATHEAAARANINRIEYLGAKIRETIDANPDKRVRIASVGCGPAREISALLTESPELGVRLDVALIDQEERSIAYCERTLAPLVRSTGARVQFIRESIRRLLTTRRLEQALGARELIYSAGLFDYLSERSFGALLGTLWGAIAPGGMLAVGNVAAHNPSRWMMEYILDWFLIHRTPEDLLRLGGELAPAPASLHVEAEPMGVNLFLVARR